MKLSVCHCFCFPLLLSLFTTTVQGFVVRSPAVTSSIPLTVSKPTPFDSNFALSAESSDDDNNNTNRNKEPIEVNVNVIPDVDPVTLTAIGFALIAFNFFIFANLGDGGIAGTIASLINLSNS